MKFSGLLKSIWNRIVIFSIILMLLHLLKFSYFRLTLRGRLFAFTYVNDAHARSFLFIYFCTYLCMAWKWHVKETLFIWEIMCLKRCEFHNAWLVVSSTGSGTNRSWFWTLSLTFIFFNSYGAQYFNQVVKLLDHFFSKKLLYLDFQLPVLKIHRFWDIWWLYICNLNCSCASEQTWYCFHACKFYIFNRCEFLRM